MPLDTVTGLVPALGPLTSKQTALLAAALLVVVALQVI